MTGGSNVMGVQDAALDKLLVAARAPGTMEARKAAYSKLQVQLAKGRICFRWRSRTRSSWSVTRSKDPSCDRSPTRRTDFGMC